MVNVVLYQHLLIQQEVRVGQTHVLIVCQHVVCNQSCSSAGSDTSLSGPCDNLDVLWYFTYIRRYCRWCFGECVAWYRL